MAEPAVKLIECPRDALQGLPHFVPTEIKTALLQRLLAAGFRHLDCVSFVSPQAVPQMADSAEVLADLGPPPAGTELIAVVLNLRGIERAAAAEVINTVGFPYSVSPTFQYRNAHQSPEQARELLQLLKQEADSNRLKLMVWISMAFGNPFGDPYSHKQVLDALDFVAGLGVHEVALADTVGLAHAPEIARLYSLAAQHRPDLEIGLHLHSRPELTAAKVRAAWQAGCRRFDAAVGGLGGCPFAGDQLVGNLATETVLATLAELGATIEYDAEELHAAQDLIAGIRQQYMAA
jgi:hydroxymethylglutaryl-CoA lyase